MTVSRNSNHGTASMDGSDSDSDSDGSEPPVCGDFKARAELEASPMVSREMVSRERTWRGSVVMKSDEESFTVEDSTDYVNHDFCKHQVSSSIWEGVAVVNLNSIGTVDNVLIIFGLITNFVLQLFFCYIVKNSLASEDRFPSVESLLRWRYREGHSMETMDKDMWSSMVSRVCNEDDSLAVSSFQENMVSTIRKYTEPIFGNFFGGGPLKGSMLALAALILWFTTVAQEMMDSLSFFKALALLKAKRTVLRKVRKSFVLESISARRFAFMTAVTTVRWGISFMLLSSGAKWLARTTSLREVILNTTALTFILQVDEALYKVFVPLSARVLVSMMKPLESPPILIGSTDVTPPFNIMLITVIATITMQFIVVPGVETMGDIHHAICGGNQDFVITAGHATGFPVGTDTVPFRLDNIHMHGLLYDAVHEAMWMPNLTQITQARVFTDRDAVPVVTSWSAADVSSLPWFRCTDTSGSILAKRLPLLRELSGLSNASTCAELRPVCGDIGMTLLRLTCSHTCGCDSPVSGLFFGTEKQGCPHECLSSESYVSQLSSMPCTDMPAATLGPSAAWDRYLQQLTEFLAESKVFDGEALESLRARFISEGCGAVASAGEVLNTSAERAAYVLCPSSSLFTTLHPFCPEACGCRGRPHISCPTSCMEHP